jgi:probable phosphoglycerate mutase
MATVLLARHGESTWNRQGRLQGWAPTRLTDRGRDEARALGDALARRSPDRLVCSDLRRTRATADAVADATGLDPAPSLAWRERDYGRLQGLPVGTAFDRFPWLSARSDATPPADGPGSGESLDAFVARVETAWSDLRGGLGADETAVVVTHGGVLRVVTAAVAGRPLDRAFDGPGHDNCAVTEVSVDGTATLVREATTDHLALTPD